MRKLLYIFSTLLLSVFAGAQTQSWATIGGGLSPGGYVNTLFVYDSVMYAGGSFFSPGNNIAQWNKDNSWSNLNSGIDNQVYTVGLYKDTIYIGGWFSKAGGHSAGSIAKWDGTSFSNAGFNLEDGIVTAFCSYDSLLYIGGTFDSVNHKSLSGLVTWDGKKTDSLNTFGGGHLSGTSTMTTYKNLLILGSMEVYNSSFIGAWNNKNISYIGTDGFYSGSNNTYMSWNAFCLIDTNLYLAGAFLYHENPRAAHPVKDTVNNITMWNGHTWSGLGKGIHGTINTLVSYNNLIIAAGSFDSAGGVPANNIAAWNGTSWSPLGNGIDGIVYALAIFDSNIYAGGIFSGGIAEFTKQQIAQLPINSNVTVYPNPSTGIFTFVLSDIGVQLSVTIYNVLGKEVYSGDFTTQSAQINLSGEAPGVYFYRISTPDGNFVNSGKLVIE